MQKFKKVCSQIARVIFEVTRAIWTVVFTIIDSVIPMPFLLIFEAIDCFFYPSKKPKPMEPKIRRPKK
jgi:hypothetical protein